MSDLTSNKTNDTNASAAGPAGPEASAEGAKQNEPQSQQQPEPQPKQQSPSLRMGSEVSLGFADNLPEVDQSTLVIREGPESYRTILRPTCAFAIRCPHGKMPLQKLKDHLGYWLPFVYVPENTKYINTIFTLYDFFSEETKK